MDVSGATAILSVGLWAAVTFVLLRKRAAAVWWVLAALVLLFLAAGFLVVPVVFLIGLGKLLVMAAGRGSTIRSSSIRTQPPPVSPRGLTESAGYEGG